MRNRSDDIGPLRRGGSQFRVSEREIAPVSRSPPPENTTVWVEGKPGATTFQVTACAGDGKLARYRVRQTKLLMGKVAHGFIMQPFVNRMSFIFDASAMSIAGPSVRGGRKWPVRVAGPGAGSLREHDHQ
jgi:hypothetical protein